jgi:uncharacterized protein (TIGR02453 family)
VGPFTGWPDEALDFYEGLEADNSKAYWDPRKAVYEHAVKAPMEALVAELEGEFGPFKIMRPYRDVRFSADKTPYKTFIGAGSNGPAGVYVAFSARGLYAGAGIWHLSRDQLVRYREAVAGAPGGELEGIEADLSAGGFELGGETLKRAPKGWAADHPRIGLLRHTSVLVGRSYPPEAWMATPVAKERIIEVWRVARPLTVWLDTHVGPAEEPIRR